MTSNINYSGIDAAYPIAGQDNDSQGFRDNFSAIQTALAIAGSEISNLQSNTLSLTGPVRSVLPVTIGPDTVVTTAFKFFIKYIPSIIPFRTALQVVSLVLLVVGVFFRGGYSVEMSWRARVAELEEQINSDSSKFIKDHFSFVSVK